MNDPEETVEAACLVFPDGAVYWCDATLEAVDVCNKRWREAVGQQAVERYAGMGCVGGAVVVRVPASVLERLRTIL